MYQILSPDGFPIDLQPYTTKEQASTALKAWLKRYEMQGYYSSKAGRISLQDLEKYCTLQPFNN